MTTPRSRPRRAARPPKASPRSRSCSPAAARSSPNARSDGALGTVGVALVFGLIIMAMVYATGHLSGAHINPAVTIAFTLTRHFPARDAAAYVAAQLAGATVARASCCSRSGPTSRPSSARPSPASASARALVYEVVLTAFLMFVIMAVATDTRAVGAAAAIAIGGTVGARRALRRPGHRRVDEPGALVRPGARRRRVDRLLDLPRRPAGRRGARRASPTSSSAATPSADRVRGDRWRDVLFVCLHNAGRSQMSRGALRARRRRPPRGRSAGTTPGGARPPRGRRGHARARHRPRRPHTRRSSPTSSPSGPTSSSRWAAATSAPTSPASATSTGTWRTRRACRSRRCARHTRRHRATGRRPRGAARPGRGTASSPPSG